MGKHWCVNGTLDESRYSSPVPVIGLYIVGATLVCFLFMFLDIYNGFRQRKRWLPCQLFSLNSLTLTLLSVAAKLPVDLTTSMPSAQDQVSKLIGSTLICICMAFFMPSLGDMRSSECISNMAALTVFVVTVIVNVCIQMGTGVIFSFIIEHSIMLFFMLFLLISLCFSALEVINKKDISSDRVRDLLVNVRKSTLMDRLRLCYMYSYTSSPQIVLCRTPFVSTVGMVSMFCTGVLSEALFRSFLFEKVHFCLGVSDYKWSMWLIVASQLLLVLLGFLGNFFRWICLVQYIDTKDPSNLLKSGMDSFLLQGFVNCNNAFFRVNHLTTLIILGISTLNRLVALPSIILGGFFAATAKCICCIKLHKHMNVGSIKEFKDIFKENFGSGDMDVQEWTLSEGLQDMERWFATRKVNSSNHLIRLLEIHPSEQLISDYIARMRQTAGKEIPDDYRLSCLSMVLYIRLAICSDEVRDSVVLLAQAFNEVFEIIYFIDKKMNISSFENKQKLRLAKELSKNWDFEQQQWGRLCSLKCFLQCSADPLTGREVDVIEMLLHGGVKPSKSNLVFSIPTAIFKDLVEGQSEDHEEGIKRAIGYLLKLRKLEDRIWWVFPAKTNITNLITHDEASATARDTTQVEITRIAIPDQLMEEGDMVRKTRKEHEMSTQRRQELEMIPKQKTEHGISWEEPETISEQPRTGCRTSEIEELVC